LFNETVADALEFVLGQDRQQLTTQVQSFFNCTIGRKSLRDISLFKFVREFGIDTIYFRQRFRT
jgi:hypothetical protein